MEENAILDLQTALKDDTQKFQITFKLSSESINIDFYKFCKYSKLVQKQFQLNDIKLDIFQDCERIQKEYNIKKESIKKFFELLQNEKGSISNDQYTDLYKLSDIFEVTTLQNLLNDYAKQNSKSLDFIINIIIDQQNESNSKISIEMEDILKDNIAECLSNNNFFKLPIPIIYRIIERSDHNQISCDLLYNFIKKSIKSRCILLQFIDMESLSDENFYDLCENIPKKYLGYLQNQIDYMKKMKNDIRILEKEIKRLKEENLTEKKKSRKHEEDIHKMKEQNQQILNENKHLKEEIKKKIEVINQFPDRNLIPTCKKWNLLNNDDINNIRLDYNGKWYEVSCSTTYRNDSYHRLQNLFNDIIETGNMNDHINNCWLSFINDQNPFIQIKFWQPVAANTLHITSRLLWPNESPSYIQIFGINNDNYKLSLGIFKPENWTGSESRSFKFSNKEQYQIYRIKFHRQCEYVGFVKLNLSFEVD